jgi:hypothetical protein
MDINFLRNVIIEDGDEEFPKFVWKSQILIIAFLFFNEFWLHRKTDTLSLILFHSATPQFVRNAEGNQKRQEIFRCMK